MSTQKIEKSDAEWRESLSPAQYAVLRRQATEPPWTGPFLTEKGDGVYRCAGCNAELFRSDAKYDSGSGWPSFTEPAVAEAIELREDHAHGMTRVEVVCRSCDGHLGHVFPDGPGPGGQRYCINGCALEHDPS